MRSDASAAGAPVVESRHERKDVPQGVGRAAGEQRTRGGALHNLDVSRELRTLAIVRVSYLLQRLSTAS